MRNKFLKSVAAGLSLALVVTSVNLPVKTASAAKKYRVVEKAVLSAAKKTITAGKNFTLTLKKQSNLKKIKNIKKKYVTVRVSKKSVATVKITKKSSNVTGFKVTAKKAGKATITVKVRSGIYKGTYKCKITVKKKPVKKKSTKKPATPTKAPTASAKPTEKPIPKNKLAISVMDESGNPVGGASIQILRDDTVVSEKTLPDDQAVHETAMEKGQYVVKVSKAGYETISYQVVIPGVGTETIPLTAKLKRDITAPKIIGGDIGDKGTSLLVFADEPVAAAANASVNVTNDKGELMKMEAPAISADGQTIKLANASGEKLPDGNYTVSIVQGIADLAGNALLGSVNISKTTTYTSIEITSTGFAPSAGQSVAYKILDNYGGEYDSVSDLDLPNAKDLKVKVSVTNKGLDGDMNVPILIGSTENLFDLSTLKKGCKIMVKVEISELSLSSDPVTVEIGDPAEATSFAANGLSIKQESGVGTDSYTVDYGTEGNPIRLGKDAARKAKIQLLMRDQYGNIMQNAKGQAVTLVSGEDASVITIKDAASQRESNLVQAIGTENQSTLWNEIAIKGIGTTTLTAYLNNGESTQMEVTVKPPKLEGITTTVSESLKKLEEINIMASYFTFDYDEDKKGQYKTPKSDLTLSCKEATDGATASDIMDNSGVLENDDHSFKGLRIKATKAAVYTMTLTSKNENQSVDFKVFVTEDEEITDIQLGKASLDIKKGGKAKSVKLNFINKYGEIINPKALKDVEGSIDFNLREISGGDLTSEYTDYVAIGYQKEDGNKATDRNDTVTDLSLAYQSDRAGVYVLEVYLTANHNRKAAITLNGSVATAASISISKDITKEDLLIARDQNAEQYIPLTILDEDGEDMSAQASRIFNQKLANPDTPDTEIDYLDDFVEIIAARKDHDGKIVKAEPEEDGAYSSDTFDALKVDPSKITRNADAITYDITVSYGSGRNTITSNTGAIKVCEIRCLNTAKIDPSKKTFTTGTSATVYATAYDQYGSKMDANKFDITLAETGTSVTDTENVATSDTTSAQNEDLAWPVTLESKRVGKVTKTFAVTHQAEGDAFEDGGNGTSKAVTKTMAMNIEVEDPSAITKVIVKNENLTLRQKDFNGNWNSIDLDLVGIDEAGNEVVISAANVDFAYTSMPDYIDFNETTGHISVVGGASEAPSTSQTSVQIMSGKKELGSFIIRFEKAAPTPKEVIEVFDEAEPLYAKSLVIKNDGKAVTISDKPFEVLTNYGDKVAITASDLTDFKSDNSKVKVAQDEDSGVTVTVNEDAVKDSTATISAYFMANGVRARTTFVVTVEQRGEEPVEPSTDAEKVAAAKKAIEDALNEITATNDTSEDDIKSAITTALSGIEDVTANVSDFNITAATTTQAGSITGTVDITCGQEIGTVSISLEIAKLDEEQTDADKVAKAKKAIEDALNEITATNDTSEDNIKSAITTALSGIEDVTANVSDFNITAATTTQAGSITGTVDITCGQETDTVSISLEITQLTS